MVEPRIYMTHILTNGHNKYNSFLVTFSSATLVLNRLESGESEGSLALYQGMDVLENSSGKHKGTAVSMSIAVLIRHDNCDRSAHFLVVYDLL
jgi:hypothetical protein